MLHNYDYHIYSQFQSLLRQTQTSANKIFSSDYNYILSCVSICLGPSCKFSCKLLGSDDNSYIPSLCLDNF